MSDVVSLDTESYYSPRLKYSLTTMIGETYARHPLFHVYLVSASDGEQTFAGSPADFNWASLAGKTVIMHNRAHDWCMLTEMERRGQIPAGTLASIKECHCSANMCAYLFNRRSLADAVEYALKIKVDKSARSDAANKHWPDDFSEAERVTMVEYARKDAHYTWLLWNRFSDQWPAHERRISNLTIDAGLKGVQIDTALLDQYILATFDMKQATEKLLPWLDDQWDEADEFNQKPTSSKCTTEQCRRVGIPSPPVMSKDQDAFDEWEETYSPTHPWIKALSSWRSVNKLLKTFNTMKERLRADGTMPFGSRYCGTITGRVSGESRVNLYNMRKQAVLCGQDGLMETDAIKIDAAHKVKKKTGAWPEWVAAGIDFRNLIIARPGHRLITSDLRQIEPRVAAWLAGDTAFLELVKTGMSVYEAHARATMEWTGGKLQDEAPKLYDLAKARVLSLGYGAGWEKLVVMAKTNAGLDLTADDPEFIDVTDPVTGEVKQISGYGTTARKTVKDYRDSNPKIVATWAKLENGFRQSIGGDFKLTLPSGRTLVYESVRAETRIELNKDTKKPQRRTVFTCAVGGRRTITYGSKLFAETCQATAREVFMEHVLKLHDAGYPMLAGIYDEAILEVPLDKGDVVADVQAIMSETPAWLSGCPVAAEAKTVERYQK